jgi:hypothetical protein
MQEYIIESLTLASNVKLGVPPWHNNVLKILLTLHQAKIADSKVILNNDFFDLKIFLSLHQLKIFSSS